MTDRATPAPNPNPTPQPDWPRWQKALSIEAETGFGNLMGRSSRFNVFLASCFANPTAGLTDHDRDRWQTLADRFQNYDSLTTAKRQQLVADARRTILQSQRQVDGYWAKQRELERKQQHSQTGENGGDYTSDRDQPDPPGKAARAKSVAPNNSKTYQLNDELTYIKGVGPHNRDRLARLGLHVVRDLLYYFPRDHIDYARQVKIKDLHIGDTVTIIGRVDRFGFFDSSKNRNLTVMQMTISDETGKLKLSRFYAGHRYSTKWQYAQRSKYPKGAIVAASGIVKGNKYGLTLDSPELELLDDAYGEIESMHIGRLLPVYPLTEGVGADLVRRTIAAVLPTAANLRDPLPVALRHECDLIELPTAIAQIHFPSDRDALSRARKRLVFDEFFYLQLGLLKRRQELRRGQAEQVMARSAVLSTRGELIERFYDLLPFRMTGAQQRVIDEILTDLNQTSPMNRLVQGDVGAGKTVVAVVAILAAIQSGYQAALMAPTEVLAEQHYRKLADWLTQLNLPVELLTGSVGTAKRRSLHRQLETGELPVLVGTHALIQDKVKFHRLGLSVIDEQHRFGVQQRAKLQSKGENGVCHVLSMTATPIPRTLALTLHGDLDVSQIDELPPGRKPIQTTVLTPKERQQAYELIRREVAQGRQTYVVLPLVEESEKLDLRSAIEEHDRLQQVFPDFQLGLLHGRMSSAEKDAAIEAFRANTTQILVSTTVIEVGVDVPNASVMLIEHAERFGLSQLHQLRGRVGRGADKSFCLLMTKPKASDDAQQRLKVMEESQDGFYLAEMDMQLRGPGEVLGTRQSGLPDFALASLVDDREALILARTMAERTIEADPDLARSPLLAQEVEARFIALMGGSILT